MNLQRREEIQAIAREFRRLFLHEQAQAIDELLAHIDALEQAAAERVIRDGSRGPTPGHAGEGGAWVPPTPVTDAALVEVRSWIHAVGPVGAMVWVDPQEVLKIAGVRVLGDGMLSIYPDALNSISDALREIGDTAHNASTGPEVPDVLWEIREKAYGAYIVATDAEAEIMQTANAHAALSSLRANQGGDAT